METVDVLIVGGAFIGGTLATLLGRAGLTVAVVDACDPETAAARERDGRASAIASTGQRLLAGAGLWEALAPTANPIDQIRVADNGAPLFLHYDRQDVGAEHFGYMVENRALRQALADVLPHQAGVTLLAPARVRDLERTAEGVTATLADGRVVRARLVVAADGRGSQVREMARIPLVRWDYHQTGIVATVAHALPHHNIAHELFRPAGPFAILPLRDNRSCVVWTEARRDAPRLLALPPQEFRLALEQRFGDFLGALSVEGPVESYPVSLQFARRYTDTRLALAGDSAHGMHYIAGQGMNMGLRDVAALAELIVDARRIGLDPGDPTVLARYQRWRRFDNTLMLALTDNLNRLFGNAWPPLKLARDLGLAAVNRLPPLKRTFIRHAMGEVGDLPRLMQGRPL